MQNKAKFKILMKQLLKTIVFVAISWNASAQTVSEFKHFNITDSEKLEKAYAVNNDNTVAPILGGAITNNLYQQIFDEMNLEYEAIGRREAHRVLNNRIGVTGGLNNIGFSYQRPFIDFGVSVDRNLAPDLFHDSRWIVTDTFTIHIDASKVLGNLRDQRVIDMTQENMTAFAGIVFNRKFTWVHFAANYSDGLMGNFHKLFMPFSALNIENIKNLAANEMIFKEDSLSFRAGGLVSAPLYSGITGSVGVLAKFEKLSRVEVISSNGKSQEENTVAINFEKRKVTTSGVTFSIQADFLKILKLTLLSYDFNYALESSSKIYLNINQNKLAAMSLMEPVLREIQQLLSNKQGDLEILAPYIISEEKKISQTIAHRYNFLLLGGHKSSRTQQIKITKAGKVKMFFRHYYEKIKFTEDAMSRIFASVVFAVMDVDLAANKLASDTKKVSIEYDSERNLLEAREDLDINLIESGEQKLSMTFFSDFRTMKTKGMFGKKYRDRAKFILERFSGVNPIAIDMVENGQLSAPYQITGKYQVNVDGIRYFNALKLGDVFDSLDALCSEQPKKMFSRFRSLFDNCRRSLQNDYVEYMKDLSHDRVTAEVIEQCSKKSKRYIFRPAKKRSFLKNCVSDLTIKTPDQMVDIPLWPLKNLANNIVNNCNSKVHYYNLFGLKNVFFFGSFNARTESGAAFTTNFHEGAFKGLGAVDHYMRVENLRSPSSIVIDQ